VPEEGRTREKKLLDTNRRFTEVLLLNKNAPSHASTYSFYKAILLPLITPRRPSLRYVIIEQKG
jgi:hypothetical protein